MIVHDAYMRVLALGDLLSEARDGKWAEASEIDYAYDCALDLLDALGPCASLADRALRRVTLEGLDLDDALRWIATKCAFAQPADAPRSLTFVVLSAATPRSPLRARTSARRARALRRRPGPLRARGRGELARRVGARARAAARCTRVCRPRRASAPAGAAGSHAIATAASSPRDRHRCAVERGSRERARSRGPPRVGGRETFVLALLGRGHRERTGELDVSRDRVDHAEREPRDRQRRGRAPEQGRGSGQHRDRSRARRVRQCAAPSAIASRSRPRRSRSRRRARAWPIHPRAGTAIDRGRTVDPAARDPHGSRLRELPGDGNEHRLRRARAQRSRGRQARGRSARASLCHRRRRRARPRGGSRGRARPRRRSHRSRARPRRRARGSVAVKPARRASASLRDDGGNGRSLTCPTRMVLCGGRVGAS